MAREAARLWSREARLAAANRGVFRVALSGGRTPGLLFRVLSGEPFRPLPWAQTEVYWIDERYVPHGHAESNCRLARETLLDHVPVPEDAVHPMPTAAGDPRLDARSYEALLRRAFRGRARPAFDLVLLGLGEDGHVASLFPDSEALEEKEAWVCASRSPKGVRDRITLTLPALNGPGLKLFLVCGRPKAEVLKMVLAGGPSPGPPAQSVRRAFFLVDRDAATGLGAQPSGPPKP